MQTAENFTMIKFTYFDNSYFMPFHNPDSVFDLKYQRCGVLRALKDGNKPVISNSACM